MKKIFHLNVNVQLASLSPDSEVTAIAQRVREMAEKEIQARIDLLEESRLQIRFLLEILAGEEDELHAKIAKIRANELARYGKATMEIEFGKDSPYSDIEGGTYRYVYVTQAAYDAMLVRELKEVNMKKRFILNVPRSCLSPEQLAGYEIWNPQPTDTASVIELKKFNYVGVYRKAE